MKHFGTLLFSSLLLLSVSCGSDNDSKSAPQQEVSPITSVDWKIFLQGRAFPDHSRVVVNGETVVDECFGKQQFQIDRNTAPQSLTLDNYKAPTSSTVKIEITDMGADCNSMSDFFPAEDVEYEMLKEGEIVINI